MLRSVWIASLLCIEFAACGEPIAPPAIPAAPENLFATLRPTEIQLNWRDASDNEDSFQIDVSIDDGPWLTMTPVARNGGTIKFPEPQPVTNYKFRVAACNAAGCSAFKEVAVTTTIWSKPEIRIWDPQPIGGGAISVRVSVISDFPVNLIVAVYSGSIAFSREQRVEANLHPSFFFYGLRPGETYTVTASVHGKFGSYWAESKTITLEADPAL